MFAQYQKLFEFNSSSDFGSPYYAQPVFDGTYFYATVSKGGAYNKGVIFRIKPDRTDFTELLDFSGTADGSNPQGSLTLSGNVLYGMTNSGGANNKGCIFKINTDGSGYIKLLDFNGTNGRNPVGSLTISGNVLYATTPYGGVFDIGCIFKINTDGSGYARLHDFYGWKYSNNYGWTSDYADGSNPCGPLTLLGNNLYGMTSGGGAGSMGTAFLISTNGGYQKIYDFKTIYYYGGSTNYGANPCGSLTVAPDGALYGMTSGGGAYGKGCVFKMVYDPGQCYYGGYCRPASYVLTDILCFNGTNGSTPYGSLTISGSILYGMTSCGGANNMGCVFKINTNGSSFTNLLNFSGKANGSTPYGSLTLTTNGTLYGMTQSGGANNLGCIFKINTNGSSYTNVLNFSTTYFGTSPIGTLAKSGNVFYGITVKGGLNDMGCIYKINADGSGYKQLYNFPKTTNGWASGYGSLTISGNVLYGISDYGGLYNLGYIFKINTDGTNYQNLFNFSGTADGRNPNGSLTISGNVLYGVTANGGKNDDGCIYKINTDGTNYKNLIDFSGGNNGKQPIGSLILSGNILYGSTLFGGKNDMGCLFKIDTVGNEYTDIFDCSLFYCAPRSIIFTGNAFYGVAGGKIEGKYGIDDGHVFKINTDGSGFIELHRFTTDEIYNPIGLTLSGSYLYGINLNGGSSDKGGLFQIKTDGTAYTKLIDFNMTNGTPNLNLTDLNVFDNALYGVTSYGGTYDNGVLFKYTLPVGNSIPVLKGAEDSPAAKGLINEGQDGALNVALYPNPNNGIFDVNIAGKSGLYKVKIMTALGQAVYNQETSAGILHVDLGNIPKGMYWISISPAKSGMQDKIYNKAFIIQ